MHPERVKLIILTLLDVFAVLGTSTEAGVFPKLPKFRQQGFRNSTLNDQKKNPYIMGKVGIVQLS